MAKEAFGLSDHVFEPHALDQQPGLPVGFCDDLIEVGQQRAAAFEQDLPVDHDGVDVIAIGEIGKAENGHLVGREVGAPHVDHHDIGLLADFEGAKVSVGLKNLSKIRSVLCKVCFISPLPI